MITPLRDALSAAKLEELVTRIAADAEAGRDDAVASGLEALLRAQPHQEEAALCLVRIVEGGHLPIEKALATLAAVYAAHSQSEIVLGLIGEALERARDIDMLNDPPPEHPLFLEVVNALADRVASAQGREVEPLLVGGLATAARMRARQHDDIVDRSCRRLIELAPDSSNVHYNYGLFLKTRGRFREGMIANQNAARLAAEPRESYEWNLGICATGAGEGAVALDVWKRLEQRIEMGRFELPDGSYPRCKVRLAERPLAERNAESDEPGLEETIWIERLSPCHGIIRSVLYQNLGVDFGDVILIDGAPITYHRYGETEVPVFPHLATLVRNQYQFFDFAGTQEEAKQIAGASVDLERDAIVYAHSESFRTLCMSCWRDPGVDHSHGETVDKHVVTGRIAAPPDIDARELLRQLDIAIAKREPCRLFVPDLCEAAGFSKRAAVERRRFAMIAGGE